MSSRLGNPLEAEEAAQESFVRAFMSLKKLRKPESFYAWLLGIAGRVLKEQFRARERRQKDRAVAETLLAENPGSAPEYPLEEAIAVLPESYRQVILLRYYEGLSCQEWPHASGCRWGQSPKRFRAPTPCCGRSSKPGKARKQQSNKRNKYELRRMPGQPGRLPGRIARSRASPPVPGTPRKLRGLPRGIRGHQPLARAAGGPWPRGRRGVPGGTGDARRSPTNRIKPERTTLMSILLKNRWGFGLGAAASAAAVILIIALAAPNAQAKAVEVMAKGARAMAKLTSIHLRGQLRTLPADNFSYIDAERFYPIELWKQFEPELKWRVEKPGRVAVMDGQQTMLYIKPGKVAIRCRSARPAPLTRTGCTGSPT